MRLDNPLPLIVEVVPAAGLGHGAPLRLTASQVVVRTAHGAPVALIAQYGAENSYLVCHAGDAEFPVRVKEFGLTEDLQVKRIRGTPESGFRVQ